MHFALSPKGWNALPVDWTFERSLTKSRLPGLVGAFLAHVVVAVPLDFFAQVNVSQLAGGDGRTPCRVEQIVVEVPFVAIL